MKKFEKIIAGVILFLSFVSIGIMMFSKSNAPNSNVVIKVNDKVVKEIPMNNSSESKIYDFNFNDHIGQVELKNSKVRILEMSRDLCPNGICSKTGWIDKTYQSIVCLPNKITITIQGGKEKGDEIDVIP